MCAWLEVRGAVAHTKFACTKFTCTKYAFTRLWRGDRIILLGRPLLSSPRSRDVETLRKYADI